MPEFVLCTGGRESHAAFDALPDFIRGYIQAAFFTGIQFYPADVSDGEPVEIDGLGLDNLDPSALRGMVADCVRFMRANADTLDAATDCPGYDSEQAGMDYWFTRNGHGVGFWDRGLGDIGDALADACRYDESSLFPVPLCPESGVPLPGYHVDHGDGPADVQPDPDDSGAWRVYLESDPDPLDADESAYLAIVSDPGADLSPVGGRYGAPMGRRPYDADPGESVTLRRVTLDPGGYDAGGAYWGLGAPLWRAVTSDGLDAGFYRAPDKAAALAAHNAATGGAV